jgi:patatin-like phospholipase/acyl hydrolase
MGQRKFNILSLDGGGLRGIIPVLVLREIEKRTGKRIHELFDLIAGTSTGGLIACALVASDTLKKPLLNIDQILAIYTDHGKDIFPIRGSLAKMFHAITALKRPEYSPDGLDNVLKNLFSTQTLTNCLKPVFIPTYDLNNNEAMFFKSRHAAQDPASDALLSDICRATSAAPTYFPPYEMQYENKKRVCIDGGVFMNNPGIGAVVEISKYHKDPIYNMPEMQFEDICMLSIGTGHYTANIAQKNRNNWGELDWAKPITDIMMQAVNLATAYQAEELLEDQQFLRLGLTISNPEYANMADASDTTRNYLIQETQKQILQDNTAMTKLDQFMQKAGLMN